MARTTSTEPDRPQGEYPRMNVVKMRGNRRNYAKAVTGRE